MKNYELVCIFDPQVGEGQFEQAVERYKTYITDNGGEIVNVDLWGLRRMAYTSQSLNCLLYTSPSPRDVEESRMPSSA